MGRPVQRTGDAAEQQQDYEGQGRSVEVAGCSAVMLPVRSSNELRWRAASVYAATQCAARFDVEGRCCMVMDMPVAVQALTKK